MQNKEGWPSRYLLTLVFKIFANVGILKSIIQTYVKQGRLAFKIFANVGFQDIR